MGLAYWLLNIHELLKFRLFQKNLFRDLVKLNGAEVLRQGEDDGGDDGDGRRRRRRRRKFGRRRLPVRYRLSHGDVVLAQII
jgi:hypothetical protein